MSMDAGCAIQDALTVQRCLDLLRMNAEGHKQARTEISRLLAQGVDVLGTAWMGRTYYLAGETIE